MESRGLPRARRQAGAPRSSRVSSRPQFARCSLFICCSRAVRALLVRCSRVVRTLFALVVRTFNFQIRVACCVRVRTRCLHAVRTLLVRCSCAVRALFVRCLCERELTRELRDAPVCRAPHTVPTTRMATEHRATATATAGWCTSAARTSTTASTAAAPG